MTARFRLLGVMVVIEYYDAIVDIGCTGGVRRARFVRMRSGWHCESIGPQTWDWGSWTPCGGPDDALARFADRWLGSGQGFFCAVLTITRIDADSAAPSVSRMAS